MNPAAKVSDLGKFTLNCKQPFLSLTVSDLSLRSIPFLKSIFLIRLLNVSDLGAKAGRTFRSVILPLAFPAVVAGSIFTFSLTLGDYITPQLVSNNQFIGNVVYANVTGGTNLPLGSAFAIVPIAVMVVYLLIARRLGAFEHL